MELQNLNNQGQSSNPSSSIDSNVSIEGNSLDNTNIDSNVKFSERISQIRVDSLEKIISIQYSNINENINMLREQMSKFEDRMSKFEDRMSKFEDRMSKFDDRIANLDEKFRSTLRYHVGVTFAAIGVVVAIIKLFV